MVSPAEGRFGMAACSAGVCDDLTSGALLCHYRLSKQSSFLFLLLPFFPHFNSLEGRGGDCMRALVVSCCFAPAGFFIASSFQLSQSTSSSDYWGAREFGLQFRMPNKVLINVIQESLGAGQAVCPLVGIVELVGFGQIS